MDKNGETYQLLLLDFQKWMIKIDKIKETWTCLTSVFDLILFHECFHVLIARFVGVFSWKIHPNALVVRWVGNQVWHEETWEQGNLRTILWEKDRTGWFMDLGSMVGEHGRKSLSWRNHAVPFADCCAQKSRFVRFWYGVATFTYCIVVAVYQLCSEIFCCCFTSRKGFAKENTYIQE